MSRSLILLIAITLVTLLSIAKVSHAHTPNFERVDYPVGSNLYKIAIGDMNRDSIPDVIISRIWENKVSVLLGKGDGSFLPKVDYSSGSADFSGSLAVGDVNRDGKPDLLVGNFFLRDGTVSVLLGKGDGKLQAKTEYQANARPVSLVINDLNRDGKPDVFIADNEQGGYGVMLGNGYGNLSAVKSHILTGSNLSSRLDDVNRDGKVDAILADQYSGVKILLGKGDGSFREPIVYDNWSWCVVVADYNRNGRLDLVSANSEELTFFSGRGDGTFKITGSHRFDRYEIAEMEAGDINGDGKQDVIVSGFVYDPGHPDSGNGLIKVLLGNGWGGFRPELSLSAGDHSSSLALSDVNRDGRLDIITVNDGADSISVLINKGNVAP